MEKFKVEKIAPAFSDERGSITDVLNGREIRHAGIITFRKGSVRAKHYHKKQTQYTYVLKGKIELTTKDLREKSPVKSSVIISDGFLASIPPNVIHIYNALEDSVILDLTTEPRSDGGYEADTYRVDE